jgi:putative addiction module component (TIGR02574 family)
MDLTEYKTLSTAEKILLVEEIWDSISDDKIALTKQQKDILNERIEEYKSTAKRTTWDAIKKKVRAKASK